MYYVLNLAYEKLIVNTSTLNVRTSQRIKLISPVQKAGIAKQYSVCCPARPRCN